ncbi:hypothetical protein AN958_08382 [Leucoagaricus sp. SymC.cos]|nr:hypothetical protein AN958_08382 [Leucoagaricus sp. SymC.cos]
MATQVPTQRYTRSQEAGRGRGGTRGRGGRKGGNARRGGGTAPGRGSDATKDKPEEKPDKVEEDNKHEDEQQSAPAAGEEAGSDDEEVCWICAEPVKYWSVSECNHRTCHVCALRLRALYKKTDCTFCKEPQPTVIFTTSPDTEFSVYKPDDIPYKDAKLSIYFETQEMMEETLILLKFNCPDASCDYIGNGWADLKLHTRAVHARLMCDLCIRHKKVFSHEHALYPSNVLPVHLPSMHHRHVKQIPPEKVEGGVHPMCEFYRDCFSGVDEHYSHMREKHEDCFICKRNRIQCQYLHNYDNLNTHHNAYTTVLNGLTVAVAAVCHANRNGALCEEIAHFEKKGGVPIPRGSFGLGAPPLPDLGSPKKKGELYGSRIPQPVRVVSGPQRTVSPLGHNPARRTFGSGPGAAGGREKRWSFSLSNVSSIPDFSCDASGTPLTSPSESSRWESPALPTTKPALQSTFASALEFARSVENASKLDQALSHIDDVGNGNVRDENDEVPVAHNDAHEDSQKEDAAIAHDDSSPSPIVSPSSWQPALPPQSSPEATISISIDTITTNTATCPMSSDIHSHDNTTANSDANAEADTDKAPSATQTQLNLLPPSSSSSPLSPPQSSSLAPATPSPSLVPSAHKLLRAVGFVVLSDDEAVEPGLAIALGSPPLPLVAPVPVISLTQVKDEEGQIKEHILKKSPPPALELDGVSLPVSPPVPSGAPVSSQSVQGDDDNSANEVSIPQVRVPVQDDDRKDVEDEIQMPSSPTSPHASTFTLSSPPPTQTQNHHPLNVQLSPSQSPTSFIAPPTLTPEPGTPIRPMSMFEFASTPSPSHVIFAQRVTSTTGRGVPMFLPPSATGVSSNVRKEDLLYCPDTPPEKQRELIEESEEEEEDGRTEDTHSTARTREREDAEEERGEPGSVTILTGASGVQQRPATTTFKAVIYYKVQSYSNKPSKSGALSSDTSSSKPLPVVVTDEDDTGNHTSRIEVQRLSREELEENQRTLNELRAKREEQAKSKIRNTLRNGFGFGGGRMREAGVTASMYEGVLPLQQQQQFYRMGGGGELTRSKMPESQIGGGKSPTPKSRFPNFRRLAFRSSSSKEGHVHGYPRNSTSTSSEISSSEDSAIVAATLTPPDNALEFGET